MAYGRGGKYPDGLNKPLLVEPGTPLEEIVPQWNERLNALFKHYDIPPAGGFADRDLWRQLAIELAFEHVPGLRVENRQPEKRGRSRRWGRKQLGKLCADVSYYQNLGHTVSSACRILAKREPWKSWIPERDPKANLGGRDRTEQIAKTLRSRYQRKDKALLEAKDLIKKIEALKTRTKEKNIKITCEHFDFQKVVRK